MDKRFIYDGNKRVKGYIQNDVLYNDMGKIVGYKSGNYITDAPKNGKILYGISNDNYTFFTMLISVPLGSVIFAVWPTIIVTSVYTVVRVVMEAWKRDKVK